MIKIMEKIKGKKKIAKKDFFIAFSLELEL